MKNFTTKSELCQHLAMDIWYYGWFEPEHNQRYATLGCLLNGIKCLITITAECTNDHVIVFNKFLEVL